MELYPQPLLFAGLNSAFISGDEFNGAGRHDPLWPAYIDANEVGIPLLMTDDSLSIFETECPDLIIPATNRTIVVFPETRSQQIKRMA